MEDWKPKQIVLASASPRRAQLLEEMGFDYIQYAAKKPEVWTEGATPRIAALNIAEAKAKEVYAERGKRDPWVLGADTVVLLDGQIMGKPKDKQGAYRMLARLSGKKHEVITAVCILHNGKAYRFATSTSVLFREMVHDEVTYYIDRYNPMDKAGAYAIQEWIGHCKISQIEGSYTNVMGLPTEKVYTFIRHLMEREKEGN